MPKKRAERDWLFTTIWVHVREEDTDAGAMYRPEDSEIPLSRRPRRRLQIARDGSASLFLPGPDDRFIADPATWREEGGAIVVRRREGGAALHIVDASPKRLLVRGP